MSDYMLYGTYKPIEVAQLNSTTDSAYNVSTAYTNSATLLQRAEKILIRTDQAITIKFNATTNDPITIGSSEGFISFENLIIHSVYVTNASGSTANLKMIFLGPLKISTF